MMLMQKIAWAAFGASGALFGVFFLELADGKVDFRALFIALMWMVVGIILSLLTTVQRT